MSGLGWKAGRVDTVWMRMRGYATPNPHKQQAAYASGVALRSHCAAAHNNQIDNNCPACRELQEKGK